MNTDEDTLIQQNAELAKKFFAHRGGPSLNFVATDNKKSEGQDDKEYYFGLSFTDVLSGGEDARAAELSYNAFKALATSLPGATTTWFNGGLDREEDPPYSGITIDLSHPKLQDALKTQIELADKALADAEKEAAIKARSGTKRGSGNEQKRAL